MNNLNTNFVLPRVAVLGAGSMGGAILAGLRAPEVQKTAPITVTTRTSESSAQFADAADVKVYAADAYADANRLAVKDAELIILAVKPWAIHELLTEIAGDIADDAIVVSVAAGVTTESMTALLPAGVSVVRAMPNTPSLIGRGVTGLAAAETAASTAIETVRCVFETVGEVLVVAEDKMDALSAVSGSGPAYLFLFAEEFAAATVRLGFSAQEAQLLAQGTITGAAELLHRSDADPAELRRQVTSPNGTTERAIAQLQTGGWGELFDKALAAAIARAREIAAG